MRTVSQTCGWALWGCLALNMTAPALASLEPNAAVTEPYASTTIPCARSKAELEKADPRLQEAFARYALFERHLWKGSHSDIQTDEKGALRLIHPNMVALASIFAPKEKPVQRLPVFEACLELDNKPFLRIGDGVQSVKIYMGAKTVTLSKDGYSDTYAIVLGEKPQKQQTANAGATTRPKMQQQPALN